MKLLVSALLLGLTTSAGAAERVRNGQFDQGNTGFTTSLTYKAPTREALKVAGTYSISNNPKTLNSTFGNVTDTAYGHDSGMGNYMIVNGSTKANSVVWKQTGIKVIAGNEYLFDNWFAALYNSNRPVFAAFVSFGGGEEQWLGTWRAERGVGIWQGMEARFIPTTSLITITLRNLTGSNAGNNFALDAVRVLTPAEWAKGQPGGQRAAISAAVPEPTTWVAMLAGFALIGTAARRRRGSATLGLAS